MKIRIKTPNGNTLKYESENACGFDLASNEDIIIKPNEFKLVDTGVVIETPKGYALQIQPRSSLFKNYGLIQTNGVGLIDCDYSGDNDFIKVPLLNIRDTEITIKKGDRLAQGIFIKIAIADFEVVESMGNQDRGGFGSTGLN